MDPKGEAVLSILQDAQMLVATMLAQLAATQAQRTGISLDEWRAWWALEVEATAFPATRFRVQARPTSAFPVRWAREAATEPHARSGRGGGS
jgi:hypothetical protein